MNFMNKKLQINSKNLYNYIYISFAIESLNLQKFMENFICHLILKNNFFCIF